MKWIRLSVITDTEKESLIADMLLEKGFDGVEMLDQTPLSDADVKKMFIDIVPELDESDESATVNCYIDPDDNVEEKVALIKEGLDDLSMFIDISDIQIKVSETEDKDWMNNWKQFFKPFRIDDTLVIKPTWETLTDVKEGDMIIEIDPGSAFGTGAHETTKLCILALKKYLKENDSVFDVGCGSGILSIASKLLGANIVIGSDIDENAVNVSFENSEINNIAVTHDIEEFYNNGTLTFLAGNVIDDRSLREKIGLNKYNIVVANILADIIMPLSDVIKEMIADNGLFICSGILAARLEEVKSRLISNNFEIVEVFEMGDWVSIVAR